MAKELPFFKFIATEWLTGDINFEPFDIQGLFINVCATYWKEDCAITLTRLKQRLSNAQEGQWNCLIDGKYINVINDEVFIAFLDEQLEELGEQRKKKQAAGRMGGKASVKQRLSNDKASVKHKDKDVDTDVDKEKDIEKNIPTLDEFLKHAIERKPKVVKGQVKQKYYEWVDNGWNTLGDKSRPILNWKSTLTNSLKYMDEEEPYRMPL